MERTEIEKRIENMVTKGFRYNGVNPLRRMRDRSKHDLPGQLQLHLARMEGRLDATNPEIYFQQLPGVMDELGYDLLIRADIFCAEFKSEKIHRIIGERECVIITRGFDSQYWVKREPVASAA